MTDQRLFKITDFEQPAQGEPVRSVVAQSDEATVVVWHVLPRQRIQAHTHPGGQDTWTIISGSGDYQLNESAETVAITAGDIVVAPTMAVHGVLNSGSQPLVFVSVVCPGNAGYAPVS